MYSVESDHQIQEIIKKSRFIAYLLPCASEAEIAKQLQQLQQQHPNASHIAFAYRVKTDKGIVIRCNDAGEPSSTAGKPILQHLEGRQLINTLAAVVRYFGGIKLGAGGLTRAYGNSAKNVIKSADIVAYIEYATLIFKLDYRQIRSFEYQLKKLNGRIIDQDFSDNVKIFIRIPVVNVTALRQLFPH